MSKQIKPFELAEIVTGLLVRPDLMGELDDETVYHDFIRAIGEVVADYCGGEVNTAHPADQPDFEGFSYQFTPYLSVYPNDSLPSMIGCVWAPYDPDGWEDEIKESGELTSGSEQPDPLKQELLRARIRTLLIEAHSDDLNHPL